MRGLLYGHEDAERLAVGVGAEFKARVVALIVRLTPAKTAVIAVNGDGGRFLIALGVAALQGEPILELLIVRKRGAGSENRDSGGDETEFAGDFHSFVLCLSFLRPMNSVADWLNAGRIPNPHGFFEPRFVKFARGFARAVVLYWT